MFGKPEKRNKFLYSISFTQLSTKCIKLCIYKLFVEYCIVVDGAGHINDLFNVVNIKNYRYLEHALIYLLPHVVG